MDDEKELCSTNVTQIGSTSVTQNWFHKHYSKLVLQTLLKIGSTSVTQNWFYLLMTFLMD